MSRGVVLALALMGAAAGAATVVALRISRETGAPLVESFTQLPEEVQRWVNVLRKEVQRAIEAGRQAARDKEAEIDEVLKGDGTFPAAQPAL